MPLWHSISDIIKKNYDLSSKEFQYIIIPYCSCSITCLWLTVTVNRESRQLCVTMKIMQFLCMSDPPLKVAT